MPQLLSRKNSFTILFLITGLSVQVAAYLWMPSNPWALVSGLLGICSVVLCSEGNILTFIFGFGQIITYTYLCYLERFYAGIAMNVFYFLSQIYGIYCWRKRLAPTGEAGPTAKQSYSEAITITTRSLRTSVVIALLLSLLACSLLVGWLLSRYTNDTQPYLDALTTVPAIAAQILMVMAFREHWYIWLMIDILYVVLWVRAENYCMVMQYAFWCINCVYGFIRWTQAQQSRA